MGKIEGDFPESSLPTQLNLSIKEQAQVIFIDNDYERRWVNGTIGMVSGIDENGNVYVLLESGVEHWSNLPHGEIINTNITRKRNGSRKRLSVRSNNCRFVWLGRSRCIRVKA